jgi:hypothetical protein
MKYLLILLSSTALMFSGCTTIGQQITNQNGTLALNQSSIPCSVEISKPSSPVIPKPIVQVITPKPSPEIIVETTYESRRVIGSYVVIQ